MSVEIEETFQDTIINYYCYYSFCLHSCSNIFFLLIFTERGAGLERTDPGRFTEGVTFKGKLIGVLEVSEARGDRMCQEALAELKIAVRAAGEHKQRIVISVAMDGIRLTDERTGVCGCFL